MNIRKFTICLVENYLLQKVGWRGAGEFGYEGIGRGLQCSAMLHGRWVENEELCRRTNVILLGIRIHISLSHFMFSKTVYLSLSPYLSPVSHFLVVPLSLQNPTIPSGQIANSHVLIVVEKKSSSMSADKTQLKHSRMLDTVTRQEKSLMVYLLVLWNAWYVLPYPYHRALPLSPPPPLSSPHFPSFSQINPQSSFSSLLNHMNPRLGIL